MGGKDFIEGFHFFTGWKKEFPGLVFTGAGLFCVVHSDRVLNARAQVPDRSVRAENKKRSCLSRCFSPTTAASPLQACTGVQDRLWVKSCRHKKACNYKKQVLPAVVEIEKQDENRKTCKTGKRNRIVFEGKDYLENTMFLVLGE